VIGRTISHYKITDKLGEGGMGVVYKAEDTKLERPVALKFLAAHAIEDPEHKARFVREAKAAARLDHQNICSVYEIDEADGQTFLAMAFLEGHTVKDKVTERPLKLDEALDIAVQTAQGLQAAHEKGIVHRDIKSANLMVTPQGQVKIMDFGLAQLADRSKLTATTTILGTPSCMSPEQAVGEKTDRRTDLWSLGVVLYEMVTGRLPFQGERQEAVLYGITNEEPEPVTALRAGLPMELERIIGKCLAKASVERYQHADDLAVDLADLAQKLKSGAATIVGTAAPADVTQNLADHPLVKYRIIESLEEHGDTVTYRAEDSQLHRSVAIRILPESAAQKVERRQHLLRNGFIAASVLLIVAVGLLMFQWLDKPSATGTMPLRKFSFTPPEKLTGRPYVAVSPNGKHVAFIAGDPRTLWIRDLANDQVREIDGTENAQLPFWSPDSEFIGFGKDKELKKISVKGAAAITLCELPNRWFFGGAWSPDGESIVFASDNPLKLSEVPARGGAPKLLFEPEESEKGPHAVLPHFLPREAAARSVLFAKGTPASTEIVLKNLESGERLSLGTGSYPWYSSTGYIVYQTDYREDGLWALPFSIQTLQPTGEAFPIAQNVGSPSIADDGTLVYADYAGGGGLRQLIWMDREGKKLGEIGQPQESIDHPDLSPDERHVVVKAQEGGNEDIWIHETDRPVKTRFTFDPATEDDAAWTPSGKEITFSSQRSGNQDLLTKLADGSGEAEVLVGTPVHEETPEWSLDGRYLIYSQRRPETQRDLAYHERQQNGSLGEAVFFLRTEFEDRSAKFSPDGRFVVYMSDESGRYEVYVRSFPDGTGKRQISTGGGTQPRWSRDGKEIFYVERDTLMAVGVTTVPSFSEKSPQVLFDHLGLDRAGGDPHYDVANDGQRFVFMEGLEGDKPVSIHIVLNWFAEFKDREQD
jgi:serine/threonine-protein kinase